MLVLMRRPGEVVNVGDDIQITITAVRGNQVSIGFTAPKHVNIVREEIAGRPRGSQQKLVDEWNDTYSTNVKVSVPGYDSHFRTTSKAYLRAGEAVVFVGNIGAQPVGSLKVVL